MKFFVGLEQDLQGVEDEVIFRKDPILSEIRAESALDASFTEIFDFSLQEILPLLVRFLVKGICEGDSRHGEPVSETVWCFWWIGFPIRNPSDNGSESVFQDFSFRLFRTYEARGNRTLNLQIKSLLLCQLS